MAKFKSPVTASTTNKCIRFPNAIIAEVEAAIKGKDCSFFAFAIEAVRITLRALEESK